jgi:hypothetical protein
MCSRKLAASRQLCNNRVFPIVCKTSAPKMPDCRLQNVRALDRLSFETAQWAFPVVVTLHNLEEAVWLPRFWQNRSWHLPITAGEFRIATALVAMLAYFVTYLSVRNVKGRKASVLPTSIKTGLFGGVINSVPGGVHFPFPVTRIQGTDDHSSFPTDVAESFTANILYRRGLTRFTCYSPRQGGFRRIVARSGSRSMEDPNLIWTWRMTLARTTLRPRKYSQMSRPRTTVPFISTLVLPSHF